MDDDLTDDRTDPNQTTADVRQTQKRRREARVSRDGDGDPIGAAVFLTAADLAALGVDLETTEAVKVSVEDGEVRLRPSRSHQP